MFFKEKSASGKVAAVAVAGLLSGVLLSRPLWIPALRNCFPAAPAFDGLFAEPAVPALYHALAWGLLTSVIFIFGNKKWPLVLLVSWIAVLCIFDLNRLQPWTWFYVLVFGARILGRNEAGRVVAMRWLLAGVYGWSGFNKLTPYFAEDNFAWFCEAFDLTKPLGRYALAGYAVALLEMTFAAGLLWEKTRPYFRWLVVGFHGLIIIFLLKLHWNRVVIPWNTAMAAMVWILYPASSSNQAGKKVGVGWGMSIAALVWVTPLLYFAGLWPHGLSWHLYANTQPEATFYSSGNQACEWSRMWQKHAFGNGTKLLLDDWANDELGAPMLASRRTFLQTARYLCRCTANADSAGLYILTVQQWDKSKEKIEQIPCGRL